MSLVEDHDFSKVDKGSPQDSFERKWKAKGYSMVTPDMNRGAIRLDLNSRARADVAVLVNLHEIGHLSVADDVRDSGETFDVLKKYDPFQVEVEAWVRGLESHVWPATYEMGTLILDCLNSYRRALGVSATEWIAARKVIMSLFPREDTKRKLFLYDPLEPEVGDSPPECLSDGTGEGWPEPGDGENDSELEDSETENADEDEPGGNEDEEHENDEEEDYDPFIIDWDDQKVVNDLMGGKSIEQVQAKYGLPFKPTPLALAIATAKEA